MKRNSFKYPLIIGVTFLVLSILLFVFIDSPQPYFAGLVIAFFAFELTFLYRFSKQNKNAKGNQL
ncbi:hypothetical protein [Metaplanococcus flavidus]|uniref:Uncharacterized protein n=1 Tax=Metaplanococcus flavidus TaxID=569883 RepID=A0ABW3LDJ8_9BACL